MVNLRILSRTPAKNILTALDKALATIEFDPRGLVITANENFCAAMGYRLAEIVGKHHSLFITPDYAKTPAYSDFWAKLNRGQFDAGEYLRLGKDGREIWLQASYSPIRDSRGDVSSIIKVASVITEAKARSADQQSKLEAIDRVQAVIEFDLDGTVLTANTNFLNAPWAIALTRSRGATIGCSSPSLTPPVPNTLISGAS